MVSWPNTMEECQIVGKHFSMGAELCHLYRVYTKQKSSSSSFCYFDDDQGLA